MERLHVHYLRDPIHRLRAGTSQRAVARDLGLARRTVQKFAQLAAEAEYLDPERRLPEVAEVAAVLGPAAEPPHTPSGVEPFRAVVEQLLAEGVEMMTIYDRLCAPPHGYRGSYSSIRRFVRQLRQDAPRAVVRVHTGAGEEVQADFGSAGTLLDPRTDQPRRAWVFVLTLGYRHHQYGYCAADC